MKSANRTEQNGGVTGMAGWGEQGDYHETDVDDQVDAVERGREQRAGVTLSQLYYGKHRVVDRPQRAVSSVRDDDNCDETPDPVNNVLHTDKKLCYRRRTARRAMSIKISSTSTATQL